MPNARIDERGNIVLLAGASARAGRDSLVLEDLSVIPARAWALGADGRVSVTPSAVEAGAGAGAGGCGAGGLPDASAAVKWFTQCRATIDGRFNRNNWTWRCAACRIDLCSACFGGARPCAHEYAGLMPGGMGGAAPPPRRTPRAGRL